MTKLFTRVDLYDGWSSPGTRQYALELVQEHPEMNFQVLQAELRKACATVLEYPISGGITLTANEIPPFTRMPTIFPSSWWMMLGILVIRWVWSEA